MTVLCDGRECFEALQKSHMKIVSDFRQLAVAWDLTPIPLSKNKTNRLNKIDCNEKNVLMCSDVFLDGRLLRSRFLVPVIIWRKVVPGVPETTILSSYPGRANFSLIHLTNSTNPGGGERGRVVSPRQVGYRVTLAGGTTFSHINTLARPG